MLRKKKEKPKIPELDGLLYDETNQDVLFRQAWVKNDLEAQQEYIKRYGYP